MACKPELLKNVPLFALLDDDETAVLASQVDFKTFAARERIYKSGDPGGLAYVLVSGKVRVSTVDEDHQEVVVDEPGQASSSVLPRCWNKRRTRRTLSRWRKAAVWKFRETTSRFCWSGSRTREWICSRRWAANSTPRRQLVRVRASRNPNEVIEDETTWGEQIADSVARFGGSWAFIITFGVVLIVYTVINIVLDKKAWDPYPFILLNLFLSMLAAIQAPVIMMSQNRQDTKDRLRGELDFDVNRRAESEIQGLARKLNLLDEKIDDLGNLLRTTKGQ